MKRTTRCRWLLLLSLPLPLFLGVALEGCDAGESNEATSGKITAPALTEISGIACASRERHYWVHNDSGDLATIYLVTLTGRLIVAVEVTGAFAVDWEDIAVGPPAESGVRPLYIADTGNNFGLRSELTLYRVPEPSLADDEGEKPRNARRRSAPAEALRFRYESGRHDTEALAISPSGDVAYLVTKGDPAEVFRLDVGSPGTDVRVARRVVQLSTSMVTGAALSGRRTGILLVAGRSVLEYRGGAQPEDWLRQPPHRIAQLQPGVQLEAVTYDHAATGFVTAPEGHPSTIRRLPLPK